MKKSIIIEIISILFALLFLYAAVGKLMEYNFFKGQIGLYPVLKPIAPLIAWFLPVSEIIVFALLLVPAWRLRGLYGALALMISLTGYVVGILTLSKRQPAGLVVPEFLSWHQQLAFNIFFLVLAVVGIVLQRKSPRLAV
ncbi:hypothetical protein SAMN05428988_1478 [Chitinophaga sp. YR573]|uniref:MauE/DoxX family redox-associated membrane protein n=1 Tax=Chitinophaga sp. YR573 TaxID=1881040 RepID=UPI0008BF5AAB|nr:MauE/DoxX family redox-associated membrane protein [Chitinophaga sp. YR573]SEW03799.1 hypothetical protein SAMN05428988_1478 [Chitinophaga sp. YR573]